MKWINIKMARREKIMVVGGALLLGIFLVFQLLVLPVYSSKANLERSIEVDEKRLKELMALSQEYKSLKRDSEGGEIGKALAARGKGFTLFSLLEKIATQAGLKDRIKYIKPSTTQTKGKYNISSVEMQFEEITLKQVFDYLFRIEVPKNLIKIKRLSLKKHKEKPGYLDATLQISTVQLG